MTWILIAFVLGGLAGMVLMAMLAMSGRQDDYRDSL